MKVRFGVVLPQHNADADILLRAASLAEENGLDSVWLSEILWGRGDPKRPVLEGWSALCTVAAATEKVMCGTLVMRMGLRPPLVAAAMFESLALIAPGRVVAGLGTGDEVGRPEQVAYGIPYKKRSERLRLLEETIDQIRHRAPGVPIWVGGRSKEVVRLAATLDGWNFWGRVDDFVEVSKSLRSGPGIRSWAGSLPSEEEIERLIAAGANHVIVAVGATNFTARIETLCAIRDRVAGG